MQKQSSNSINAFILTFIFPFAGLIIALNHWREKWAKNVFWLVCIYLGAVLVYCPAGTVLGDGSDGGRYVLKLINLYKTGASLEETLLLFFVESESLDLYFPLSCFFISRFTDSGHVMFAFFAAVFGYFYSRNIWYVLEKLPIIKFGGLIILVTLFFLINPITHINGVRFNTAVHVYIYALLPYLLEKDKRKLWWLVAVPLIHFSFLFVVVLTVLYVLLTIRYRNENWLVLKISIITFILSMFVSSLNISALNTAMQQLSPDSYEKRINDYVNEDTADVLAEKESETNWYVGASGIVKGLCYGVLLFLLYPCFKRNNDTCKQFMNMFVFALLFGALANILSFIPSGGRFQMLENFIELSLILLVATRIPQSDKYRNYVKYASVLLLLPFVVDIRKLFDFFSITAVFGNYLTVFFWENNVPLIYFLK